jgi:type II secretory pathway pseudopilin PulG
MTKGFSLPEILISITCIVIILGMSAPLYGSLQTRKELEVAVTSYVASLRTAQLRAQALYGDSEWGVVVGTGSILIFKGSSYALRATTSDESISVSPTISVSGIQSIVFSKMNGIPNTFGTTTFTSVRNETKSIFINQRGVPSF